MMLPREQPSSAPLLKDVYFPWSQAGNRLMILEMIASGELDARSLITHRLPYDEAAEAYRLLRDEKDSSLGVVLEWRTE